MIGLRDRVIYLTMKLATIVVTRSKSCHVKTLHTVLRLNLACIQMKGVQNEVVYVNDDPFEKSNIIHKYMKNSDRILFIDFGISMDDGSIQKTLEPNEDSGCVVFPTVKEGIDWGLFKARVKNGSTEPVEQIGLHFDTEVGSKISDDMYQVVSTTSRCWMMVCKNVLKRIKDKRTSEYKIPSRMENMFDKFRESGVKIHAYTAAKLIVTYSHECISNLLNAAGVKAS